MAAAALHNTGIDGDEKIRAGRAQALAAAHAVQRGAAVIEADENELVYEITFDIQTKGFSKCLLGRTETTHPFRSLLWTTTRPTTKSRTFDVIQNKLAGVWSAINLTTHKHHEQHSYNSERYERTGVY